MNYPKMSKWAFGRKWCTSTFFGIVRLYKYNKAWDRELNRLLDEHWQTAKLEYCVLTLGEAQVWIENKYYAYGRLYSSKDWRDMSTSRRPSIKTMWRLASLEQELTIESERERVVKRLKGTELTYEDFFV
jgi:hypothetical protein